LKEILYANLNAIVPPIKVDEYFPYTIEGKNHQCVFTFEGETLYLRDSVSDPKTNKRVKVNTIA
jgi:hypothetical protein